MVKAIFKLFRKQFIALAFEEEESRKLMVDFVFKGQRKPAKLAGWDVAFIDELGRRYYLPVDDMTLCIKRLGVIMRYNKFLETAISPTEIKRLYDTGTSLVEMAAKKRDFQSIAKIQAVLDQLNELNSVPLHEDLLYRIAANFYIREDEDPAVVDVVIEEEKIETFRKHTQSSEGVLFDFFHRTPLRELFDSWGITSDNLTEFLSHSEMKAKQSQHMLEAITAWQREQGNSTLKV